MISGCENYGITAEISGENAIVAFDTANSEIKFTAVEN